MTLPATDSYAAGNNFGSLNRSPRTMMAHAMHAILLRLHATAIRLQGVPRDEYLGREDVGTGPLGVIGNIVRLLLAGW